MLEINLSKEKNEIILGKQKDYLVNNYVNFLMNSASVHFEHSIALMKGHERDRYKKLSSLNYNIMLNRGVQDLSEVKAIENLLAKNVTLNGFDELNKDFKKTRRTYDDFNTPIAEHKETNAYARSYARVVERFGGVLHDTTKLFDYQIEGAALIGSRKRLLNGMDMGLGKTRTTIAGLYADPSNTKILIVTMSRNLCDWEAEIENLGLADDYIVLHNPSDMKSTKRIHLVSYERWASETKKTKTLEDGTIELIFRRKPLFKYFNRSYKAAAVDEGHLFKNGSTTRCKSIMAIKTRTRVVISGTPAENGASDLFWLLAWMLGDKVHFWNRIQLEPFEAFGTYGERCFKTIYGGADKKALMDSTAISSRVSSTQELWSLLDLVMYRRKKTDDDVASVIRIPKPVHRRLHVAQNENEKEVYAQTLKDFGEWFKMYEDELALARMKGVRSKYSSIEISQWLGKLRQTASCPWLHPDYVQNDETPSKLQFIQDKIQQEAMMNRKMLIFTAHKKTCEELGVLLNMVAPGYEVGYIHGSVPMHERHELLRRFQDPKDPLSCLVMTMKTGAESYTLTEAKSVVLFDLDYNAKKIEQCYSRAVRLGQREEVEITWLITIDTIEANMRATRSYKLCV